MRVSGVLILSWGATLVLAQGQPVATTITLTASPNPSVLSQPVTLTATVTPPPAAGSVTFYDGATAILGVSAVTGGKATLVTSLLGPGARSLQARYSGGANTGPSTSTTVPQTVRALPGRIFNYVAESGHTVTRPLFVAVADFNRDGHLDLAVATYDFFYGGSVSLFMGDGAGNFKPGGSAFATLRSSNYVRSILVGDFNRDGNPDLIVESVLESSETVDVLLGDGRGNFQPDQRIASSRDLNPLGIAVGDFDRDGNSDLAIAYAGSDDIAVFLGDGQGGFAELLPRLTVNPGFKPCAVAVGDFNGDSAPDLAVASCQNDRVLVWLGNGKGSFVAGQEFGGSSGHVFQDVPDSLTVGDFNGDGSPDLALWSDKSESVFFGNGTGNFTEAPGRLGSDVGGLKGVVGDFNGDGKLDVANATVAGDSVRLTAFLGDGAGEFTPIEGEGRTYSSSAFGFLPTSLALGDFNEDGRLDIVAAIPGGSLGEVALFLATDGPLIAPSTQGTFVVGGQSAYSLAIRNPVSLPIQGEVKVSQAFPAGLTPQKATGNGWGCLIGDQVVTCTRSDALPGLGEYPAIIVVVGIGGTACPSATTSAEVRVAGTRTDFVSIGSVLSGCLTVVQQTPGLVVNRNSTVTLTVSAASGAVSRYPLVGVAGFLPDGLGIQEVRGDGWSCFHSVSRDWNCYRSDDSLKGTYPEITIKVEVGVSACPTAFSYASVRLGNQIQDNHSLAVDLFGCLQVEPLTDMGNLSVQPSDSPRPLNVSSNDRHALSLQVLDRNKALVQVGRLNPNERGVLDVPVSVRCYGTNSTDLTVTASADSAEIGMVAAYPVQITAFGEPDVVSFPLQDHSMLAPDVSQALSALKITPSQQSSCAPPNLAMSFLPKAADGTSYDFEFDPATGSLKSGTVAGTILMKAQVNGADITPHNSSASIQLQVPSLTGVIQTLSIDARTGSTFQVGVTGYSTPRETGPAATTEVCFAFLPAAGASLPTSTPFCALKQDIAIWYERPLSYPTGSRFKGSVTVSFTGDVKAIGQIKAWIKNKEGDGTPSCIDFQSGANQPCK
jgi:hypothetical protein